jgi:putative transcriptional regulator
MASHAGSFLVARPILEDPNFHQTVVLLLQHGEDGAFGVTVNRPAKGKKLPYPVFVGGPCESPGIIMLHGHEDWLESAEVKGTVAPGIYLGDASCLTRLSDAAEGATLRYRMFAGYAGWGAGQLERELAAGAWAVVPADGEVLFDTPVDELWIRLLPPMLPEPSLN